MYGKYTTLRPKCKKRNKREDRAIRRVDREAGLPPAKLVAVHHSGVIVPTLSLTPKTSLCDSGVALLLVLHSRLQYARVCKIY